MESRKRKLSGRAERARPSKRVEREEVEEIEDEASGLESEEDAPSEEAESGDKEEGEEEGEEEDSDGEETGSPAGALTFGQMLRRQEKMTKAKPSGSDGMAAAEAENGRSGGRKSKAVGPGGPGEAGKRRSRSSKHAPAEMSSRFAVKRGRDWLSGEATIAGVDVRPVEVRARDPRFFLASMGGPASRAQEVRAQRNYAFLDAYRESEAREQREALATAEKAARALKKRLAGHAGKGGQKLAAQLAAAEQEAAALRRTVTSTEARQRDRAAKEKAQAMLDAHKKREQELVRQGKRPFYLKKSEQKKQLLVDQFASMTDQQVDKVIDRRRKKQAANERRAMP